MLSLSLSLFLLFSRVYFSKPLRDLTTADSEQVLFDLILLLDSRLDKRHTHCSERVSLKPCQGGDVCGGARPPRGVNRNFSSPGILLLLTGFY